LLQQNGQRSGAYFDSLLEKSRKRAHGETTLEELPSLQLGLGDLRQRIRKIGSTTQDQATDGRAQYLLAGSGVDLGAAVRDLSYFEAQTSRIERAQPSFPVAADVEGYLANLQTQTTLSMIADGLSRSVRDFDTFLEDNVTMEWDAQRKRIYQHFGIKGKDGDSGTRDNTSFGGSAATESFGQSRRSKRRGPPTGSRASTAGNGSVFGRSGLQKSVIGTPGPIGTRQQVPFVDVKEKSDATGAAQGPADDRLRRDKEGKFAEKVQNLNSARVNRQAFPILQEFCNVESQNSEEYVEHVVKAYKGMMEIVEEASEGQIVPGRGDIKERQFAAAYLDESQTSASAVQIKKRILQGTSRHLEKQFFQELEAFIAKNPREANLGGVPNVMSKVRAFVRLRAARKDLAPDDTDLQMLGEDYVWALIFYLLRSGHVREAVEYVASNAVAFRAIDRNFVTYITDYHNSSEKRLRRELQDRINNEYNQRVRIAPEGSIDPFRMACYNIIGRCDMVKKSLDGLYHDMPDWLWLQFTLAREVNRADEIATEVYGLNEVQATIDNIVSKHATSAPGFGVFFYLQILSGRFEQAIHFLYSYQYVDAVHFAIALDYYGMLRVAGQGAPDGDLLTFSTRGQPQLSFARMIGYYTQDFRAANVVAAVDYLTLLCLNSDLPGEAGKQQAGQCHEALRELVLESREFAQLLGDVREDGQRLAGAIEERIKLLGLADTDDFVKRVTIQAASIADDNGRVTDAVLLYHLAEEYNNVLAICNRSLSEAVAVDVGEEGISLLPLRPRSEELDKHQRDQRVNTLSLTSIDDPVVLAKSMYELYVTGVIYNGKFSAQNRNTCEVLLRVDSAKKLMAQNMWADAIDVSFFP
jgi:nuclear pore complex protein Nup93